MIKAIFAPILIVLVFEIASALFGRIKLNGIREGRLFLVKVKRNDQDATQKGPELTSPYYKKLMLSKIKPILQNLKTRR